MKRRRVIILFGGPSVEREVSRISARTIAEGLDPAKYEAIPIGVAPDGRFLPSDESQRLIEGQVPKRFLSADAAPEGTSSALVPTDFARAESDVVFPIIHGTTGEDGTLQGFLDTLGLPYVGPSVLGSAVGMDKAIFKAVMRDANIPVTPGLTLRLDQWQGSGEELVASIRDELPFPLFVKPANGGSSVGVSKAHEEPELITAIEHAFQYDNKILVEQGIDGRELECSVLGNESPRASVLGEVIPGHEFYDYDDKYVEDGAQLLIPAKVPKAIASRIRQLAVEAFRAAMCEGMARVDFLLERGTDRVFLNELNTLPGFTAISMYPKLWEASGLPLRELLDQLVELAVERQHKRKERLAQMAPPKALR